MFASCLLTSSLSRYFVVVLLSVSVFKEETKLSEFIFSKEVGTNMASDGRVSRDEPGEFWRVVLFVMPKALVILHFGIQQKVILI